MSRARALLLYLALSVPFGIAVHLGSEFAGLGRDADDLAFSPLHGYLAAIAVAAAVAFLTAGGFFAGSAERRRRMALWAGALPWRGRGAGFFVLSVGMQLAFFATTQLGEGCPVCKGDAIVGFSAALLASLAGSLILNLVRVRLVRAIVAWGAALDRARRVPCPHRQPRYALTAVPNVFDAFARTLGNRPPPASLPA